MHALDYGIIAIVLVLGIFAFRYTCKHKNSCAGCSGCSDRSKCSACPYHANEETKETKPNK